jgi:RNA polymerase sigma factor (sigma-70 family)
MPFDDSKHSRWYTEEVQPHGEALRAYLLARFPSLPDVDNVVQECLVRLWRANQTKPVEWSKGMLFTMARNLAIDFLRRQKVASFESLAEFGDSAPFADCDDVAESVCKKQELDLLTQAVQSLPDRCRQVFTLRYAYHLSHRQVAEKLSITENTVEKQMTKAIARCTEFLARHGVPPVES